MHRKQDTTWEGSTFSDANGTEKLLRTGNQEETKNTRYERFKRSLKKSARNVAAGALISACLLFSMPITGICKQPGTASSQPEMSRNWSGYAVTTADNKAKRITMVKATWIVNKPKAVQERIDPRITAMVGKGLTRGYSQWIGIDGYNNHALIQEGTAIIYLNGKSVNYAWYELIPDRENNGNVINHPFLIPGFTMKPKDVIYAKIKALGVDNQWQLTMINKTENEAFSKIVKYKTPMASAEWIVERQMLPLFGFLNYFTHIINTGTSVFGNAAVEIDGKTMNLGQLKSFSITMRYYPDASSEIKEIPSKLSKDGRGFSVDYEKTLNINSLIKSTILQYEFNNKDTNNIDMHR